MTRRLLRAALFILPPALLCAAVRLLPDFAARWSDCVAQPILRTISSVGGKLPFSLMEWGALALLTMLCAVFIHRLCWNGILHAVVCTLKRVCMLLLALVWLRVSNVPIFTAVLIVMPIAYSNVFSGLSALDRDLLEMADAFHMRAFARLKNLYFPALLPYLRAAVATGMGMAWKSGVAAEVICVPKYSLGSIMYRAKIYLETPELLAATVAVILLSMSLEKIVLRVIAPKGGTRGA